MSTHIKQIQLKNYRSCISTTINLQPRLSALIGANGSGKSNVLNGITLLGKNFPSRQFIDERGNPSICKLNASFEVDGKTVKYQSVIRYINNEKNIDSVIDRDERWNFGDIIDYSKWINAPLPLILNLSRARIPSKQLAILEEQLYYRHRYVLFDETDVEPIKRYLKKITRPLQEVFKLISGIVYYSASQFTDPTKCPTFFEIDSARVERNDEVYRRTVRSSRNEHSQFMYDLYLAYKKNTLKFQEFISIVGKDGIGLIDKITYKEVQAPSRKIEVYTGGRIVRRELTNLLIIPTVTVKGTKLSPNQLSEGTFKTLAIIFYLVTDESQLLLLEEPEVCVHHGLLGSIMQLVKEFSREKQIVISTHSDFVLDGLDPTNVFTVKYQPTKGTVVQHVPKAMSKLDYKALREYLNNDGNLGEYWRHGDLENGI
ncbi:MAG: ATP-binding protein [Chloroflexi bacterium]|nr:ATP-binding protein [Chloroflexota bacterium]